LSRKMPCGLRVGSVRLNKSFSLGTWALPPGWITAYRDSILSRDEIPDRTVKHFAMSKVQYCIPLNGAGNNSELCRHGSNTEQAGHVA